MDFTTNYCGMYWSDGRVQSSVVGTSDPVNDLDGACQEHDAAYAGATALEDYETADINFNKAASELGIRGKLYGALVLYGNKLFRMGSSYTKGASEYGAIVNNTYRSPNLRSGGPKASGNDNVVTYGVSTDPDGDLSLVPPNDARPIQLNGKGPTAGPGVAGVVYSPEDQQPGSAAGRLGDFMLGIVRDPGYMEVLNNEKIHDFSRPSTGGFALIGDKLYKPLGKKKLAASRAKRERKEKQQGKLPPRNKIHIDNGKGN